MEGLDVVGADAGGILKAGGQAASDIYAAITKPDPNTPPANAPAAQAAGAPGKKLKGAAGAAGASDESFLDAPLYGPVKVWHALAGAAAGAGVLILKRIF